MSDPWPHAHTVTRRVRSSRWEAAAPAGDQRQDWSQGRAPVPPTALRRQPAAVTPGDGDRTITFPGKRPPWFPHCTLPQRYGVPSTNQCGVSADQRVCFCNDKTERWNGKRDVRKKTLQVRLVNPKNRTKTVPNIKEEKNRLQRNISYHISVTFSYPEQNSL